MSCVIRLVEFEIEDYSLAGRFNLIDFVFREDGVRHDVFFGGPVSEIAVAAALAAEREVTVNGGIGGRFANRTFVEHGANPVLLEL